MAKIETEGMINVMGEGPGWLGFQTQFMF